MRGSPFVISVHSSSTPRSSVARSFMMKGRGVTVTRPLASCVTT